MGILKDVRWAAAGAAQKVKKAVHKAQFDRSVNAEKRNREMLHKKDQYLPQIEKFASKYGATVEAYDTKAYVVKEINGRDVGVNIAYGESPTNIRLKLDRAFTQKPLSSRVLRKVKNAGHRIKEIREEMGEAGEAIRGGIGDGSGNMWNDPNFGGNFRGSSGSSGMNFAGGGHEEDDDDDDDEPAPRQPRKRGKRSGGGGSGRVVSSSIYGNVKMW